VAWIPHKFLQNLCAFLQTTLFFVKIAQIFVKSTQNVCVEKSHTIFCEFVANHSMSWIFCSYQTPVATANWYVVVVKIAVAGGQPQGNFQL
jgi:hypothetical protein